MTRRRLIKMSILRCEKLRRRHQKLARRYGTVVTIYKAKSEGRQSAIDVESRLKEVYWKLAETAKKKEMLKSELQKLADDAQ